MSRHIINPYRTLYEGFESDDVVCANSTNVTIHNGLTGKATLVTKGDLGRFAFRTHGPCWLQYKRTPRCTRCCRWW